MISIAPSCRGSCFEPKWLEANGYGSHGSVCFADVLRDRPDVPRGTEALVCCSIRWIHTPAKPLVKQARITAANPHVRARRGGEGADSSLRMDVWKMEDDGNCQPSPGPVSPVLPVIFGSPIYPQKSKAPIDPTSRWSLVPPLRVLSSGHPPSCRRNGCPVQSPTSTTARSGSPVPPSARLEHHAARSTREARCDARARSEVSKSIDRAPTMTCFEHPAQADGSMVAWRVDGMEKNDYI